MFSLFGSSRKNRVDQTALNALDVISANVMVADETYTIIYMNKAIKKFLKSVESELQQELPNFNVATLIGTNIDIFHKNPAHQRRMLGALTAAHKATIKVGKQSFDLLAAPLEDASGHRIGTVVEWRDAAERLKNIDFMSRFDAISKAQAVIEFEMDGTVIDANTNFLTALGYSLPEIKGKHHSLFIEPTYRDSNDYKEFWAKLNRGDYQSGEYKRIGKGGKEVWIQASYNPILDEKGKPYKVVKFATDVTAQKMKNADYEGQLAAIRKSQAVIEFNLDGTIREANTAFLTTLGYSLADIQGKHHSLFIDPAHRDSDEYKEFWAKLNRGEYQSGEYKRIGKGGKEIYIQASYNPILDLNGKPYKVVKYASDVTRQVLDRLKSQHVNGMMQQVAAGAEELNASVKGIAEAMVKSKDTATEAYTKVGQADSATQRLSEAAQSMGGIVQMINSITGQINLLALNATIESARAGEAGKGFAVVANEVKNLANQAKNATEQISKEINGMRGIADEVVGGLNAVKDSIEHVREYVTSTAAAVEEQSAVANEMSSSMQRAAAEANNMG